MRLSNSSAFAVTGAMVGAGISLGGGFATDEYVRILAFWFTIPVANAIIAYSVARTLRSESMPESIDIPLLAGLVGYAVANIQLTGTPKANGAPGSIAALIPAFLIPQLAIVLGIPISFNKVMISSIVGAGLVVRSSGSGGGVSASKAGYTLGAWVFSMVGAGLISFGLYHVLAMIPGFT